MSQRPKSELNGDPSFNGDQNCDCLTNECLQLKRSDAPAVNGSGLVACQSNQADQMNVLADNWKLAISSMKKKKNKVELLQSIVDQYEHEVDGLRKRLARLEKEVGIFIQSKEQSS